MRHCPRCGAPIPHDRASCWSCDTAAQAPAAPAAPVTFPSAASPAPGWTPSPAGDADSMFPPLPPGSQLALVPPLPGEWLGRRCRTAASGSGSPGGASGMSRAATSRPRSSWPRGWASAFSTGIRSTWCRSCWPSFSSLSGWCSHSATSGSSAWTGWTYAWAAAVDRHCGSTAAASCGFRPSGDGPTVTAGRSMYSCSSSPRRAPKCWRSAPAGPTSR
jgi:hypothetical protein